VTNSTRYEVKEVQIEWVKVVGRHRKDLGDLGSLAKSIEEIGLIHPITVTEAGDLIAGQRRIEAYRLLGRETIPARIVSDLTSAVERLLTERDENTERKPMTPEELVSVGKALEALERPKAKTRQQEGRIRGAAITNQDQSALGSAEPKAMHYAKTDEVVAKAIGMSPTNYYRAKKVVEVANDPKLRPEEREMAKAALEEMNATGKVSPSYERVRQIRPTQPAKPTLSKAAQQRRAITSAIATLSGVAHGLDQIEAIHPDITSSEAAQWVDGLSDARRSITVLITRLKERINAEA